MFTQIQLAFSTLDATAQRHALLLAVLIGISSFFEALGVGIVFGFIKVIGEPGLVAGHPRLAALRAALSADDDRTFLIYCALGVLGVFLVKNLVIGLVHVYQTRFLQGANARLSTTLLRRYLAAPYGQIMHRNSAELVNNTHGLTTQLTMGTILGAVRLSTEVSVAVCILAVLFAAAPLACIIAVAVLGSSGAFFAVFFNHRFERWGRARAKLEEQVFRWLQQSVGAIKEAKVLGREGYFLGRFADIKTELAHNRTLHEVSLQFPRLFYETVVVTALLMVVVLILWRNQPVQDIMAQFALFAAAGFRLMPSMNRISTAITAIKSSKVAVEMVCADMSTVADDAEAAGTGTIDAFARQIAFEGVGFRYPESEHWAVRHIDLEIRRGEFIGLVGATGAGKSTLVDLLLGLLTPTEGRLRVDGTDIADDARGWRRQIGYVPQSIYLLDDTVRRNVALGIGDAEIDDARVRQALRLVHLDHLATDSGDGLNMVLGERGIRLSGGQRQRIGIARAIYNNPRVLLLDEATAALDNETEWAIAEALRELMHDRTLIVIAHRLSTVKHCDRLFMLDRGEVTATGAFDELMASNADFVRMVRLGNLIDEPSETSGAPQSAASEMR